MLMQVLAARGDTAAALAVYDRLRRAVRDELGVDPGPEVRRLHRRLLQAASDISRRDPTRASSPAGPPVRLAGVTTRSPGLAQGLPHSGIVKIANRSS